MSMTSEPEPTSSRADHPPRRAFSRRRLLSTAGIGGAGALVGAGAGAAGVLGTQAARQSHAEPLRFGTDVEPFHGRRQAGITTAPQAHLVFLALDLRDPQNGVDVVRLLRLLTDDAARLTAGEPALADTEPELAVTPAAMTVTFGFGRALVEALSPGAAPDWLDDLPSFRIDALDEDLCGGDLALQLCGDDPLALAHARRILLKDARPYARPRWIQEGFRSARGVRRAGATHRNLFGQVDGTVQPGSGGADDGTDGADAGEEFVVWGHPPTHLESSIRPWIEDGTSMVVRRIRMDLDGWDELARSGKEAAIGRDLAVGAPLTGERERDAADFEATTPLGFPVIEESAHMRRARAQRPEEQMLRRSYNYDRPPAADEGISDSGQLFITFQADVARQFLPVQRRLAELDRLNEWTTPIGSAVFAVPPGCEPGGYIGDVLA